MHYTLNYTINYHSPRYNKNVTVPKGYVSDGATGAIDIQSEAWKVHDWLCGNYLGTRPKPPGGQWDDGTPCTNWQASTVLSDILKAEGRWIRARYWWAATWLFGGGKARDVGMY